MTRSWGLAPCWGSGAMNPSTAPTLLCCSLPALSSYAGIPRRASPFALSVRSPVGVIGEKKKLLLMIHLA